MKVQIPDATAKKFETMWSMQPGVSGHQKNHQTSVFMAFRLQIQLESQGRFGGFPKLCALQGVLFQQGWGRANVLYGEAS